MTAENKRFQPPFLHKLSSNEKSYLVNLHLPLNLHKRKYFT